MTAHHRTKQKTLRGLIHGPIEWRHVAPVRARDWHDTTHARRQRRRAASQEDDTDVRQQQGRFLLVISTDPAYKQPHRYIVSARRADIPTGAGPGLAVVCRGDLSWRDEFMSGAGKKSGAADGDRMHRTFTLERAHVEFDTSAPRALQAPYLALREGQRSMRDELVTLHSHIVTMEDAARAAEARLARLQERLAALDPLGAYCRVCAGTADMDGLCLSCYLEAQAALYAAHDAEQQDATSPAEYEDVFSSIPTAQPAGIRY